MEITSNITRIGIIHLEMVKDGRSLYGMGKFDGPKAAERAVRPLFKKSDREVIAVMSLNAKLEPMAAEIIAIGGSDSCVVDMKNVFKHAILTGAVNIICFHNHPSGDPKPSIDDRRMTKRMVECGKLLDINILDHIILGDNESFYSFKEQGELLDKGE